jgi:hypothetical protein
MSCRFNTDSPDSGLDHAEFPVCFVMRLSCHVSELDVEATARRQEVNIISDLDYTQKELYFVPLFTYDEMAFSSLSCHTLKVYVLRLWVVHLYT